MSLTATAPLLLALALFSAQASAADAPASPRGDGTDGKGGEHMKELLAKFDTNHDGKLDDGEKAAARAVYAARIKEKHPELFAKIDTNGDGVLSEDEMKAAREKLKELRAKHGEGGGKAGGPGRTKDQPRQ